jgi:hypothetical protein
VGQGNRVWISQGSCFKLKKAFILDDLAEHSVLKNRELMAFRQRKLIAVSGKYSGPVSGFWHNQKDVFRSIYYKDGWRLRPNCSLPDSRLQEWTVSHVEKVGKDLDFAYLSIIYRLRGFWNQLCIHY